MSNQAQALGTLDVAETGLSPRKRSRWTRLRHVARKQPLGVIGLFIVIMLVLMAIFAPVIAPYDPISIDAPSLEAPSSDHYFGTDARGRDVFSRVVYGSRISLQVGLIATFVASLGGALIGLISGYFKGRVDMILQRFMDSMQSIPFLVLALVLVSLFGNEIWKLMIVVGIAIMPGQGRVLRSVVLRESGTLYIEAARSIGATSPRIMFRHILPNIAPSMIILGSSLLGAAILIEAGLSFLGFGTPPPAPSWGGDLSGSARQFFVRAPWMAIFPGAALSLVVLGVNLMGDSLRDILDPRMRNT